MEQSEIVTQHFPASTDSFASRSTVAPNVLEHPPAGAENLPDAVFSFFFPSCYEALFCLPQESTRAISRCGRVVGAFHTGSQGFPRSFTDFHIFPGENRVATLASSAHVRRMCGGTSMCRKCYLLGSICDTKR